ncbi:MAG TPA: carboxylesterase/lipase family protein [Amnibacterium sp.]|uniref:carboxylesterase/lipase family protein n=1 Tax=Amnibacterium sp. TaxID=1872496 RepID=UPI002F929B16
MSDLAGDDGLVVATRAGLVRGRRDHGLVAWRGIPYMAPPVGPLRYRAPQPLAPWTGIRNAAEFGPVAPQPRTSAAAGAGRRTPMSEDAMTVSVLRRARSAGRRPVMVYLHGGGFGIGAGSATAYDGAGLVARGDVVFVTVNYRLGALGWVDLSRFSRPDAPIDGNLGLRDLVAALQWVRENIAAFGGDPDDVTIFGESAGATAVLTLLCVPAARGLVHRAIAQSPVIGAIPDAAQAAEWAEEFRLLLDATAAEMPERLRSADVGELMDVTKRLGDRISAEHSGVLLLAPVIDGDVLPQRPLDAFVEGRAAPVPLVIGTNADEGTLFQLLVRDLAATPGHVDRLFEQTLPSARQAILGGYPAYPKGRSIAGLVTDLVFWAPAVVAAAGHSAVAPTWMYRFDFSTPLLERVGLGATHAAEIDFVFGRPDSAFQRLFGLLGGRHETRAVVRRMHARWLRFASAGDPGEDWPRYDTESRRTLIIDAEDRVESDPRSDARLAWEPVTALR